MGASISILTTRHPSKCVEIMEESLTHLCQQIILARRRARLQKTPISVLDPSGYETTFRNRYNGVEEEFLTVEELKMHAEASVRAWKIFAEGVGYLFELGESERVMEEAIEETLNMVIHELQGPKIEERVEEEAEEKGKAKSKLDMSS